LPEGVGPQRKACAPGTRLAGMIGLVLVTPSLGTQERSTSAHRPLAMATGFGHKVFCRRATRMRV